MDSGEHHYWPGGNLGGRRPIDLKARLMMPRRKRIFRLSLAGAPYRASSQLVTFQERAADGRFPSPSLTGCRTRPAPFIWRGFLPADFNKNEFNENFEIVVMPR